MLLLRIFFTHFGKHCFCVIGSNEGARSMSHKLSFADRRHAFADIRYWNTCMQQNQSRYKEVPQWEIFMEQKLSFGLVFGRFAILKRFNCVIWEMFPFSSFIKADNLPCIRYHLRFFKAWVNWMENSTILLFKMFFCRSTSDYKYGLEDCKILIFKVIFHYQKLVESFWFFLL